MTWISAKKNAEKKLKLDVAGGDFVIFLFSDDEHAPAKCPYIATKRSSSEWKGSKAELKAVTKSSVYRL